MHSLRTMDSNVAGTDAPDERLDEILRHTAAGVVMVNREGRIQYANAAALGGRQAEEVIGQLAADPTWKLTDEHGRALSYDELPVPTALRERREVSGFLMGIPMPVGMRWMLVTVVPLFHGDGELRGAVATLDDVTERRALAAQLAQAQKMEGIGQLAGGMAHDFNNLLTGILGTAQLALAGVPTDSPLADDLRQISAAAQRGAALTRQVLTFARKQVIQPRVIDVALLTDGTVALLRRMIGEHIVLRHANGPKVGSVKIDPGELEQVIVNMAINARDAMPDGGELWITSENRRVDAALADAHPGAGSREFVALTIRDSGHGMSPEVLSRAFEPFYTTKSVGSGTGLGLSICYGIVRHAHGFITVDSTVGQGTTFVVYLPRVLGVGVDVAVENDTAPLGQGTGAILLVEDEVAVRTVVERILRKHGYLVLAAGSGYEALAVHERTPQSISLLITDVIMPGMRGPELARTLVTRQPGLPVLFTTGYADLSAGQESDFDPERNLLVKPFTPEHLVRRVQQLLVPQAAE